MLYIQQKPCGGRAKLSSNSERKVSLGGAIMIVKGNYINGQWVNASSGKRKPVINPATGQEIAAFYDSTKEDVRQAIAAAKKKLL